jgi:hypothetical protein
VISQCAIDAVVREVVEIQDGVDPDPNLHQGLRRRSEIDQQYLLLARRVFGLRRCSGRKRVAVFLRGQQAQISVPQSVQLCARREHLLEARDVIVEHQVEVARNGVKQGMGGRTIGHRGFTLWVC